ncbi:MAG: GHKL domain-containing protein [Mucispirillum schaedleri]|nr:GHKL domain-containing protein [Mucispirillum schaedleri]
MFSRYNKVKEEQMLQEVGKVKYEEKKQYYNKIENLDEKYRELLHNINHYLRQIGIYAENNQTDKIKQVLANFKERALKDQVCIEFFVETGFKIEFIKETDLAAVLGNLLDNSLEAVKKCGHGKINASFFMQNQGLLSVIHIENTYNGLIDKVEGGFVSTKNGKEVHGIGIKSVNNIINRYNGYIHQEYSDSIFKTTVIIPLK